MKTQRRFGIYILFLSCVVFLGARWYFAHSAKLLDIARAQVFAFPLFVAGLWFVSDRSMALLRPLLASVVVIGLTAVGFTYNHHTYVSSAIVVAPLQQDSFATQTRITQDALEAASRRMRGQKFLTTYEKVSSQFDAEALLKRNQKLAGVVWGNSRWLTISFAEETKAIAIGSMTDGAWSKPVEKLQVVTKLPSIGISYNPLRETALFLSLITMQSETSLRAASELQATWSTYGHRPYADLLLGNFYLQQVLQNVHYNYGDLDCAIRAYQQGWQRINAKDNLELKQALLNNLAVATYVQGIFEHDKELRTRSRTWLAMASRPVGVKKKHRATSDASTIAQANFLEIRNVVLQKKKKKK